MKQRLHILQQQTIRVAYAMAAVWLVFATVSPIVDADSYDVQIQDLAAQNNQTQANIVQLQEQSDSYQDMIARLQAQLTQLQAQITDNQNSQIALQQQIAKLEQNISDNRQKLGSDIRQMYLDGKPSTLEELASSGTLSEFVDRQTYREAVQHSIQASLQQIKALQHTVAVQKNQVDKILQDQQAQQLQLASVQGQQQQLLNYNQDQQASYTQQMQANQSKISALRAEQAASIRKYQVGGNVAGDSSHGGYPNIWNDAPQDSTFDSWGMYNRECVSYTAFKVHQDYVVGKVTHDMPYWGGSGDANQWPANAQRAGIPVDTVPTVGSIAISTAGTWGHSMYVEKVGTLNGRPAIYVSQYNADFAGHYSEAWRYVTGLVFIHF